MRRVSVALGTRSYSVFIGTGLLEDWNGLASALGTTSLIVTSTTVGPLYLRSVTEALADHPYSTLVIEDGDAAKKLVTVDRIITAAVTAGVARDGTFIALGGGALGDVVGLAAALYHRGIDWIQLPTTLLAQVDAAVGGKTAVNHSLGKNLIGAFHQPRLVVCDVDTLTTLPARQLRAGLAEVIKYALVTGTDFLAEIHRALPALNDRDPQALADTVEACCRVKARLVASDEVDQGRRGILNLGHTFGHAIESAYKGDLLHGEAVAIGCVMAARMSQTLGRISGADYTRVVQVFEAAGLPVALPQPLPSAESLLTLMRRDKKVAGGVLRLVLFSGLCKVEITDNYPHASLIQTLRDFTMTE